MAFSRVVLFTILVTLAKAGPVHPNVETKQNTCAIQCSNTTKFHYQLGNVYEFSYDAKTTTKMNGASEDAANINMNAKVEIEPVTKCDFVMRIKDATLRDSEGNQNSIAFKEAMMKQTLKFSFQDGRIDHICAMDGESTWTLNIKRGILSAFQNSMDSFDRNQNLTETDVVGSCDAEYKILSEGRTTMIVKKSKNLLGCSDREGYRLAVQSIGYNVPSMVKSLPLMKSEYRCTQTLDLGSNTLKGSTCSEEHVFRPFSKGGNGAMTSSEQTLTFTNTRNGGHPSDEMFSKRSTLLFEHQDDRSSKQESAEKIEAKLQELCKKASEDIRPEVPEMVNQLIEQMRQVDRDVLSGIYRKINQKKFCAHKTNRIKQYFHDAIPMVGTPASVGMIQDLISKKHVIGSESEMWLLSLSFVHHPTKEMVAAAQPLLDERDVSGNTLLAVASLASSYCNVRPDCGKDSEISALIRKLIDLTQDCNTQKADTRRIVFALRALGNIGHSHEAVSHLARCSTRRDVPEEIRIAAMDAFRRVPCDAMRSDLMGVFRDESEDSELRLNAYIALMKCPSKTVLSEVREVLEKEKSNQVGSFVWTHLTNLMETSDPHMQDIRNIVQDEELKKEFNLDQRKFSRNYEGSFFLDSINTGAKVDSNVIFSEKSFIPRSANLNLTIDLFGQAINFLEFGGRVQGMEKILENFFGPTGVKEPETKTKLPLNFDKSMDAFRASAFMRVFGNELRYWDDKSLNELLSSLTKLMNMQAISFSKTMQLLDSRMTIPTCVGLPLNLKMSATGSISLDAKASMKHSKFELNVDFKPSASVQVKGEMSVDAHVSRAGLKMVTVAHTSTGAMLNIRNNKFDLQIPEKKMEIFNLKTDFYMIHRNTEKRQKMIFDNVKKQETCTGKWMKQVTGLTFCQAIKFPVVYDLYMMNEDAPNGYQIEAFSKKLPYSVYIDTPGSRTQRRIALKTAIKNKNEVEITLNAPWKNIQLEGAFINRRDLKKVSGKLFIAGRSNFAFNAQLGVKTMEDSLAYSPLLEITLPQKKLKYKGIVEMHRGKSFLIDMETKGFTNDHINLKVSGENLPENIGVTTQLRIGKKEYYAAGSLGKLVSKSGFKYTSALKITIPNRELVELTSEINYDSANRASLQFTLKKEFSEIIHLNASLAHYADNTKSTISLLFALKSPKGSCEIIGHTDIKKALWVNSATATYNFGDKYSDHLVLSSKFNDLSTTKTTRILTRINLKSESHSSLDFHVNGELSKNDNLLETKVDVHPGSLEDKTVNSFNFYYVAKKDLKTLSHIYNYAMSIQHPGQNINYKVEANHIQSAEWPFKIFENEVVVQMATGKVVQTKLSYNNAKVKGLPTYESEVALSYLGRDMKIVDKLTQVNKNTYENLFTAQWQKGQEVLVKSTYTKTGEDIRNIENTLRLPNKKVAKASAMLQVMPGAYKAKVRVSADENIISRQRINYKVEGGVTYTFNAKQISSGVIGEIMWAPNQKVAANINFDYVKKSSLSGKVAFSTPFDAMKNFDSEAKFTWANSKYTSMMTVSLNNQNELKQECTFIYPDFLLSYDASAILSGKKSEISISMKYSDMSLNGNINVSHDKTTIINVVLKHNAQKMGLESGMALDFDILDSNGKMKITLKYDKRKGELMSNGEGKLNLPLQQLRQIGGSYNLKHNIDLSSIDMGYSSSLKNYRNGKMAIEMRRNLPKMLKTKIDMTLNNEPLFNINANYGNQKDNIDMKIDITEPNGQKITVSGNVNLSGSRKTGNVELKSRYINFSTDANFEYKGTRSADVELNVKINGKNLMASGNYNTDAAVNVNGIFVLPDGRKIDGKLILKNKDGFHTSFVLNCPGFQHLKLIDIGFTKLSDSVSSLTKGHMEILPHLEKSEIEARLSTRDDTTFVIGLKTPSVNVNQVHATMTLRKKSNTLRMMESEFWLNKNKIIGMKLHTDMRNSNDILTSFELKTSHRRFDSVIAKFRRTGNSFDMKSSVDLEVGKEIKFDMKLRNSDLHSEISLKTHLINLDDQEILLMRHRDLNNLKMTLDHKYGGKEGLKCEFLNNMNHPSITITVKYPGIINYDLYMDLNMEDMTSSVISNLATNGQVYELFVTYRHMKNLNMTITVPSFNQVLHMAFAEKSFKVRSNAIFNNQNYNAYLSIDEDFGKIDVQFNTPYSQNSVFLSKNGSVKNINIDVSIVHNGRTYKLIFSNIDYYHQLKSVLTTPSINISIDFLLNGNSRNFNTALTIQFNNRQYEMEASNTEYIRNMNFMLNTPAYKCDLHFVKDANKIDGIISASIGSEKYKFELKKEADFEISLRLGTYFKIIIVRMGNANSSVLNAHFKAMPYLDECLLEARFVNKGAPKLDFVLKTSLNGLEIVTATVSLERNTMLAQELKLVCSVNNQTLVAIKFAYNIDSIENFTASLGIKIPNHRFDEIDVDLKYFRQRIQIDSSLKAKFARELNFEAKIQNTDKMSEMSLKARLGDYDTWETLLTRSGLRDNMAATFSQKIGGEELFSGKLYIEIRDTSCNIKIKSSVVNFEFESILDLEDIGFGLHSSLELQKEELYNIIATYEHMTKLHVRTSVLSYNSELTMRLNENGKVFNTIFKVMPYFDTIHIEIKSTRNQFSMETKTKFESMEQAKVAVTFDGDWVRSQKIKAIIQLNNEQMVELDMNYNFESITDFIVNMAVITPHRHYKEFLFDMKNKGSLRDMQLSLKSKLTNLFTFDVMLNKSRRVNRMSLGVQLLDFDEWKSKFELKNGLDYMTANIITSIAEKEINRIDVILEEYGRAVNVKINSLKVINFDFSINLDPEAITFNMASTFTLNGREKYEMSVSYEHLSNLQIKTSIPSYQDELLITFSGNMRAFNMQTKFSHNSQMYELMLSNKDYYRQVKGNLNTPYFQNTLSFRIDGELREMNILAQVMHNEDKFDFTFSNKGYYHQIKGNLNTPYFQDTASFKFDGEFSAMNIFAQVMHNKDKFELTFSNKGYYEQIDTKLDTPFLQPMLKFSLIGNPKQFNVELKIQFDNQIFEMKASNGDYFRQMNFLLDSPFLNCNFQFDMKLDTQAIAFDMASTFTLNGRENYGMSASYEHLSKLQIKTSIPSYNDELLIMLSGNHKAFNAQTKFSHNSQMYELMLSNKDYYRQVKGNLNTPYFQDTLSFMIDGDFSKMNILAQVMHNKDKFELTFSNKGYYRQLKGILNTPYFQDTVTFKFDGELREMNILAQVMHNKDKFELTFSNKGYYRQLKGILNTPYFQDTVTFKFHGELREMNIFAQVMHNEDKFDVTFSNKGYYRQLKGILNTPYFQDTVTFKFDGELREMNILAQVMHNKDKFELTFSNKGYYQEIDAKLVTPFFQPMIQFSLSGIPQNFNFELRIHLNKLIYEMKASIENYFRQMNFLLNTPKLNCNFRLNKTGGSLYLSYANANSQLDTKRRDDFGFNLHSNFDLKREEIYKIVASYEHFTKLYVKTSFSSYDDELTMSLNGDQKMFNALAKFTHNQSKYELIISNQGYYRKVDAQLITPFFTDMASFIFNGDEETFTAQAKFMHENDQYELVVSNRNHYKQMNITLTTPSSNDKLNIDLEGDLSSFESFVTFSHNEVEYKLQVSNEGYYRKMNAKLTTPSFEMDTLFNLDGIFKTFNLNAEFSCCHKFYKLNIGNIEYYQSINVELNTPSIQAKGLFKYNGDLEAFNSTAIFTYNGKKYELTMANVGYYQGMNATLSTPFSSQSAIFNMKGQWRNFTLEASVKHNQYTYNFSVYNLGFFQDMSARLSTPSFKINASFGVAENLDNFKVSSHLAYNEQHYQLSAFSLRNHRNMEFKVKTPSFTTEASFNLIREKSLLLAVAKLFHNDKLYRLSIGNPDDNSTFSAELITPAFETDAVFTIDDKQDTLTFVSRITYDEKKYQLTFSSTNYYRNIKAKIVTPLTKTEAFMKFDGDLRDFNLMTQIAFNGKHYGLNIANSDIYRKIWTKLITPQCTCFFLFNLKGNLESFSAQATFAHNNTQYKLSVSNKQYYEQMNIILSTPHFNRSFTVNLNGDFKALNIKATFNNNNDRFELMVSNKNYYQLISIKLTTPFSKDSVSFSFNGNWNQFSSKIKVMYQKDQYEFVIDIHDFEMWASLKTPSIRETATFSLKGKSHAFNISMGFSHNNSDYKLLVSVVRYYQRINIELFTPFFSSKVISNLENQSNALKVRGLLTHATQWHEVVISNSGYYRSLEIKLASSSFTNTSLLYDLIGNLKIFTLQTTFTRGHDQYNLTVSNKDLFRQMGAHISTPYLKNSFSFYLNGDLKTFELRSTFKRNTELYEIALSNKNYFGQINAHLVTPYLNNSFLFHLNDNFETFDLKAIFKHNTEQYELLVSNKNYFRLMSAHLVTPHLNNSFLFNLNGDFNTFDLNAIFTHHTKQYELRISNKDYFRQISANLSTPSVKDFFSFHFNGDFRKFDAKATLEHNTDEYELSVSNNNYYRQMSANVSTPSLKDSFSFNLNGDMKIFDLKATIMHNIDQYEFTVSNRGYYQQITTNLKTPVSEDSFTFSLDGSLTNFTLKFYALYNNNPYEVVISSSGYYREFDANLTSPFLQCSAMFSLTGHLESFQFLAMTAYNADKYQLQISNRGYFDDLKAELIIHNLHTSERIQKTSKYQCTFFNNRFPHQIGLQILTPLFDESINCTYAGNLEKFNAVFTAKHNDKIYSIKISNRDIYRQMKFQMNTPYIVCGFRFDLSKENDNVVIQMNIGKAKCELLFSGNMYSKIGEFRLSNSQHNLHINSNIYHKQSSVTGDVTAFLDKKKFVLNGDYKRFGERENVKIHLKTPYFYDKFQGSITGTLKKFDAIMKFQHNKDSYEVKASSKDYYNALDLSLKTPAMKVKFNSVSDVHNCKVSAVFKLATGFYELIFSNQNHLRNIHMEVTTPQFGNIMFTYDLQGEPNNFNFTSQFSYMKNTYEFNVLRDIKKGEYRLIIISPLINVNGHFNGDFKSFSFEAIAVFQKQKYEILTTMKNYFREISGKLTTPKFGEQSLSMKINGKITDFNGFLEVKNYNKVYRSEFSLENNQFQLSLPKWVIQVKLNGSLKNFDFSIAVKNNNEAYRSRISLKNQEFKGSLHLPGLHEKLHAKFLSCRENIELFIQLLHNYQKYEMSFTKTTSMKSHIIISQWGAINVSINGDLKNGQIKMKVNFENNIFENSAQMRLDGSRLDLDAKILYDILGQSGQFDMQFSNIPDNKLFKSELRFNAGDIEMIATSSLEYSPQMNAVLTLNSPTFDNSTLKLRVVSEGFHKIDAILNLKTPWKETYKMFYQHNIDDLSSKAYIKRNEIRLAGYSALATFNSSYIFNFKCDYNNYSNKLLVKGDLKFQGSVSVANFRIDTSFGTLKELYMSTKMAQESLSGRLNLRQKQRQIGLKFDKSSSGISLSAKVNTYQNRQYQLQISNKHTDASQTFDIRIVHPVRTTVVNYNFENTQHSKIVTSDLIWDEARDQKIGFELMIQKNEQNEGKLRIITPRRTVEIFCKVGVNGNHYSTVGHIMMDETNQAQKVDIKADVMISSGRADIDLTIKFPNQKKGMNLKTSINLPKGDLIFSSTSEFSMDQDPKKSFKMSTKLMSETKGKRQMYTLQMDAKHAESGFDTEVIGRVSSTPDKYNADVEIGYLTLKRQLFAIRGEVNRFNREVNLKLEYPSKTIELDGSLTTGNRYIMSFLKKETGKEIMEALIKLSPNAQRMNIIFNYDEENPDKEYRIDAEIMESKIFFKAFRAGKGSKSNEDAVFYAELNPHSILTSIIRWNPHLFREFNVFGNQKLQMYGRQLRNLEESFRNVFNDEVFEKIVLVKNSFGEELSSFRDNVLVEFGTFTQDLGKVWQELKEMYQRNYFYLKSGTENLYHVYDNLWSNYQEKLGLIRMTVDNCYKKMMTKIGKEIKRFDHKYAHYEVVFMKKSSEIFAYCRIQSSRLSKNAMKMQADIYKSIERHRSIIKEVIDVVRRNSYGEMVIDFLVEMYEGASEKTVHTRKQIDSLASFIYSAHATLNRHIVNARRYSIVDVIMNAANKVYQKALRSYNYKDVKDNVLELKNNLYKFGAKKIKEIKNIITDIGMNTLVFDPKRGEIIVEIRFGAAKYFYNHFMSGVEDIERAVMKLRNLMPNFSMNVWDIYYMMKPSTDIDDHIPPFKAKATLFAGQHITTFDGRHLIYKGQCSYLLARDFVDGNFTVVANFVADHQARTLKSINITTAHNEQLEIVSDKVLFNGRVAKLPLQLTDATVTLQDNVIVVESKRGYKVMCDHNLQLYTVQISGWYFNKVAGLFGNFNNEPKDDMLMSNNKYTNDLERFAQSWSVSRQCKPRRNVAPSHIVPESRECAQLFLQIDSPFRYCFRQVNPNNFYKTCATQMSLGRNISHDLCKVTSFYIEECERKGVFLQQPAICKSVSDKVQNRSLLM